MTFFTLFCVSHNIHYESTYRYLSQTAEMYAQHGQHIDHFNKEKDTHDPILTSIESMMSFRGGGNPK